MLTTEQPYIRPEKVRELRMARHMTQQELASFAELSLGQVNRIESGKIDQPQFRTVRKLARVLGVDPSVLLKPSINGGG